MYINRTNRPLLIDSFAMQKQREKTKKADDSVSKHRKGIFLHFFTTKDSTDFSIKTMSCSFLRFKNSILQNFLY